MLKVENLSKSKDGKILVDDVSLTADSGEILAVIGPNGAGKSTLLKMLAALVWPTVGSFNFQDRPITLQTVDWYLTQMGTNLSLPRGEDNRSCLDLLKFRQAYIGVKHPEPEIILKTVGLLENSNTSLSQLSSGMRSRLALGLALAAEPPLLLLDEPTVGIDASGVDDFVVILRYAASRNATTVLVSHDFPLISALADRILFIDQGRIADSCAQRSECNAFLSKYSVLFN